MKKILSKLYLPVLLTVIVAGCEKNSVTNAPYDAYGISSSQGQLKIVYASAYLANPTVRLKINGQIVSNGIASRTPFPGGGYNTAGSNYPLYLTVPQGNNEVAVSIVNVGAATDSIVLYKTSINLPDNSPYTLHITDTLVNSTTNKTTSILVKNLINPVDSGFVRYRFINLIPNVPTTNGAVDLYLNGIKLLSNIAYKQASDTFRVAIGANTPGVTDPTSIPTPTWAIRPTGASATSTAIASYASTNTMVNKQVYTIFSMGYNGATGTRLPYLSFTLDRNQ
jgi:hypothetical protein